MELQNSAAIAHETMVLE